MRQSLAPVGHPETRVRLVCPLEGGGRVVILKVVHEQDTGQEVILRLCTSAVGKLDHAEPLVSSQRHGKGEQCGNQDSHDPLA